MSKAMDYLLATRGEVIGPYFKFLKQAGDRLDPKTRSLVSLIGKVHAQSESGLRQYLPRALRDGATAAEILDVLLFSLPLLGLTRINWAIEIILAMDIPEFAPELLDHQAAWHPLGKLDEFQPGEPVRRVVGGRALFVLRHADLVKVYDSHCPHQLTDIPQHCLDGQTLTCPTHGWKFDLLTGDCVAEGSAPLRDIVSRLNGDDDIEVYF